MQRSNICWLLSPNMVVMAFSDSRQVLAISTVGTLAEAALAMPGLDAIRQHKLPARSAPLVAHDATELLSPTSRFGVIVHLLLVNFVQHPKLRWRGTWHRLSMHLGDGDNRMRVDAPIEKDAVERGQCRRRKKLLHRVTRSRMCARSCVGHYLAPDFIVAFAPPHSIRPV
jgi:hypothetical protein